MLFCLILCFPGVFSISRHGLYPYDWASSGRDTANPSTPKSYIRAFSTARELLIEKTNKKLEIIASKEPTERKTHIQEATDLVHSARAQHARAALKGTEANHFSELGLKRQLRAFDEKINWPSKFGREKQTFGDSFISRGTTENPLEFGRVRFAQAFIWSMANQRLEPLEVEFNSPQASEAKKDLIKKSAARVADDALSTFAKAAAVSTSQHYGLSDLASEFIHSLHWVQEFGELEEMAVNVHLPT